MSIPIFVYNGKTCTMDARSGEMRVEYPGLCFFQPVHDTGIIVMEIPQSDNLSIAWPNREGELIVSSKVPETLERWNAHETGLSIVYPSTASCRTVAVFAHDGSGAVIAAAPDEEGKVNCFRIRCSHSCVQLEITTAAGWWYYREFLPGKMEEALRVFHRKETWNLLEKKTMRAACIVQIGLIGPDGKTKVPEELGFGVLPEAAEVLAKQTGGRNILHVFGYAHGHDLGYPDYTPSPFLGGSKKLRHAIEECHGFHQQVIFYMNGRIAQKDPVEKDTELTKGILLIDGEPVTETYHDRTFYVMDPLSVEWQDRLVAEAEKLRRLGADGVQLDQLGGRMAPTSPGSPWGLGYVELIRRIQALDMLVWIQGLSDIYPADWFEMTWRNPSVESGGSIRGGMPLGRSFPELYLSTVPGQTVMAPISKLHRLPPQWDYSLMVDAGTVKGELFLYDDSYFQRLEEAVESSIDKVKIQPAM